MPDAITLNQWVPKGWGGEHIVVNTPEYCGKRLFVLAGRRCSWHFHEKKDETFCVQSGHIWLWVAPPDCDDWPLPCASFHFPGHRRPLRPTDNPLGMHLSLRPGGVFHIPPGTRHRFEAVEDTWLLEFSTHDDPADSIRIEAGDVL